MFAPFPWWFVGLPLLWWAFDRFLRPIARSHIRQRYYATYYHIEHILKAIKILRGRDCHRLSHRKRRSIKNNKKKNVLGNFEYFVLSKSFFKVNKLSLLTLTLPLKISNDKAGNPVGSVILSKIPESSEVLNSISNSKYLPTWKFLSKEIENE